MNDVGIHLNLCDSAVQFGDESNLMSCGHRVHLEDFVPLDDVVVSVLVPEVAFFPDFRIAGK